MTRSCRFREKGFVHWQSEKIVRVGIFFHLKTASFRFHSGSCLSHKCRQRCQCCQRCQCSQSCQCCQRRDDESSENCHWGYRWIGKKTENNIFSPPSSFSSTPISNQSNFWLCSEIADHCCCCCCCCRYWRCCCLVVFTDVVVVVLYCCTLSHSCRCRFWICSCWLSSLLLLLPSSLLSSLTLLWSLLLLVLLMMVVFLTETRNEWLGPD